MRPPILPLRRKPMPTPQKPPNLGEYPSQLAYQVLQTGKKEGLGPLVSPIEQGPDAKKGMTLDDVCAILKALPFMGVIEQRRQLMLPGRDALWDTQVIPNTNVPASSAVSVVSFDVPEGYAGAVEFVGTNIDPQTSYSDLNWSILVNGAVHPGFNQLQLPSDTLAQPLPFRVEITQKTNVVVRVENTSLSGVTVSGIIILWTEPLAPYKEWGTSPASGIG